MWFWHCNRQTQSSPSMLAIQRPGTSDSQVENLHLQRKKWEGTNLSHHKIIQMHIIFIYHYIIYVLNNIEVTDSN